MRQLFTQYIDRMEKAAWTCEKHAEEVRGHGKSSDAERAKYLADARYFATAWRLRR